MTAPTPSPGDKFSLVDAELEVLEFWERRNIFQRSLDATRDKPPYIFYDGPPFATGLPHHGHLLASTLKDIIPRYFTMCGRHVQRRFGWDCHGLPVEHEIDKQLNMSTREAVKEFGVRGYNDACRDIVQRYVRQWRQTVTRLGRWVDFEQDYKTMDLGYMESVWWVVKQLWDKDLLYQGRKVVPVSTALGTSLANFEASQNYREVQDPAITVLLPLEDDDASLAVWTTTPWTLPSNLAVCVHPRLEYLKVRDLDNGRCFYLAQGRFEDYARQHKLQVLDQVPGIQLKGRRYRPPFDYFHDEAERGGFQVVCDEYVTDRDGTGLVHQAPAFGEDDYRILRENGIEAFVVPVTEEGLFTDQVPDFAGRHVKEADRDIIRALKEKDLLYEHSTITHSYPFCYRSETPLIYRAIPAWYVKVEALRERLLAVNEQINWVPEHIQDGRFGKWLEGARDWSISRSRVWGTPLPLWVNDKTGATICIGSVDELERYSGERVTDLHREHVDVLTFTVSGEEGQYKRVPEVLDCWFESGSMPYAQLHYPFENKQLFQTGFPAEFIAEGLDQTRGWFYTLTVLATALFDEPAFRNVIVSGLVLAEDGNKMSKSKRNYTPPDDLVAHYGADALRLYLITSGLVKAEEQRFVDSGLRDITRRALLPWYNAFNFLETYCQIDNWSPGAEMTPTSNILDNWIISRLQTLKSSVQREMEAYHLYNVVPGLLGFIEELTNTYIRLNRPRFWGEQNNADKFAAYSTLYTCLLELSQTMAPFVPFLSETLYRRLRDLGGQVDAQLPESVHLCSYPRAQEELRQPLLEQAVSRMQQVILLGRQKREQEKIPVRQPLARLTIIHRDQELLDEIAGLEPWLVSELNVKRIEYSTDESGFINLYAKANFKRLGPRLGKRMREYADMIAELDATALRQLVEEESIELGGERFDEQDVQVLREARVGTQAVSNRYISIDMDLHITSQLVAEGMAREFVNRIQRKRKELDLHVADRIRLSYCCDDVLAQALQTHRDYVAGETLALHFMRDLQPDDDGEYYRVHIGDHEVGFTIEVSSEQAR